jgi:2-keto-3-deoxy-L-rhamnonate aldolase RhmA
MKSHTLKEKLANGEATLGSWICSYDLASAETMVEIGFDWQLIDLEHSPFDLERLEAILMTFKNTDVVPIARVAWNDINSTKRVMDLGAEAILVPMVNSRKDAEQAVSLCKYPPLGTRGVAPRRAAAQGEFDEYVRQANERMLVMVQIEHIDAVQEAEAIMTTPGLDGVIIGKIDLMASMGLLPQWGHPDLEAVVEDLIATAKRVNCPIGMAVANEQDAASWAGKGVQMMWITSDLGYMYSAAAASLERFRKLVNQA